MSEHAKLSPSSSTRWLSCTASIQAADQLPEQEETTNAAAEEGTKAHQLHEELLLNKPLTQQYSQEMREGVEISIQYIERALFPNSKLIVEEWLPLTHLNIPGLTGGTADAIIVNYNQNGQIKSVEIIDFKFGLIHVDVEHNTQLLIYAVAIIERLKLPLSVPIRMTITQPRSFSENNPVRSWTQTVEEIVDWATSHLIPKAKECNSDTPTFKPSDKACQWCPVSGQCQSQNKEFVKLLNLSETPINNLTSDQMKNVLAALPVAKSFIAALEKKVHLEVIQGSKEYQDHLKIVKKKVHRRFTPLALQFIHKAFPQLSAAELHEPPKMLSPAKVEKLLPKFDLSPVLETQVPTLVVAPITDRRKAFSPADDFEDV